MIPLLYIKIFHFLYIWVLTFTSYAIKALKKRGIICCMKMEVKKFDHTNWHAFTEYGMRIMKWGDKVGQKNETESNQQTP